jgi:phenylacetate-coenzyme A ligase PaaK-like adenylate-forming protein
LYKYCGLNPNDIRSIEDISKIPVIDKKVMVEQSYNDLLSKKYERKNLIPVKTAGSNGMPFLFYIDRSFDQFRKAQCLRPYFTNGLRLRDCSIVFSVYNSPKKKWHQLLGLMNEHYIYAGLDVDEQIKIIQNKKPDVVRGYGSVLNLLSFKIIEKNFSNLNPRLIFTDSELLLPESRQNIKKAFKTEAIDVYGTYETDNIAYECTHHQGYHITNDSVIMEFINNGIKVKPNEEGEIVVTILNNFAMPFIRYNLHDVGSSIEKLCSCGRTFPLMNQVKGRANDYMITGDGRKLSFFNIAYFDKLAPHVREYQIVQEDYNSFNVFVVPGNSYNNQAENVILPAIKKFFPSAEIALNVVTSIDREQSGKFKAFKSKVMPHES